MSPANLQPHLRQYRQLIGGEVGGSLEGSVFRRLSPAHDVEVGEYPKAGPADVSAAVAAARKAFDDGPWRKLSGAERARILSRAADLIEARADDFSMADVLESGKPFMQSRGELKASVDLWRYAAGLARELHGDSYGHLGADMLGITMRDPIGVVAIITPWNFPFAIASQKLPFALAAGCTAVCKPSEFTPGSTLLLAEILGEAGLPPGVCNIIAGDGAVGQALAEHDDVDMVSFTGSTAVGRSIVRASAATLKKTALELGGKNPQIVCADADLRAAADAVVFGVYFNAGQCCNSSSRLLVERSIAEEFTARVCDLSRKIVVGDPLDEATMIGAIINPAQLGKIERYIEGARKAGASVVQGGSAIGGKGLFMAPTVVTEVTPDMAIAQEEVFGPVLSVLPFADLHEAVSLANNTHYGLSAGIWTASNDKALSAARELRAGTVWVNCFIDGFVEMPLGGIKQSGLGRELGRHAVEEYTEQKSLIINHGPRQNWWIDRPLPSA